MQNTITTQEIKPVFWYMLSQRLSALSKNIVLMHALVWVLFAGIFFLGINSAESLEKSTLVIISAFLPSIPAVYLHFFVFDQFFRKKKYLIYIMVLAVIVYLFGTAMEWVAKEVAFTAEPDAFIAGKMSILFFLLLSIGLRSFFEGLQAKSKLNEIEAKQAKAELESLKSQVNPHFLFNSLNNIYGLLMEDKDKAGDSLLTLSSLLRYLIYASQKTQISLEEEVNFLDDYMAMERLRLGDKCRLSFNKEGYLANKSISPFLLIPFVENAFKHGSFATVGESFIEVNLEVAGNQLTFQVKNSTKPDSQTSSEGTGIANVKRRLELQMPEKYTLDVDHKENVFTVNLELEL